MKTTDTESGVLRHPLFTDDSGAVAVIVAVLMVVLLGVAALVIDVGSMYAERRKLQTAADAAALAAVQELPADPAQARAVALAYAADNASEASAARVYIENGLTANDTVRVELENPDTSLFFASIWGQDSADVGALATARVTSPIAYGKGVMPFGVLANGTIDPGQYWGIPRGTLIQLKFAGGQGTNGDYGMVAMQEGANWGAKDVEDAIKAGGSPFPVYMNHVYSTVPGNKAPVDECLYGDPKKYSSWIGSDTHHYSDVCSAPDPVTGIVSVTLAPGDVGRCHRLILLPVIIATSGDPYAWPGGNKDMKVVGFAEFFVPPDSDLPGGAKAKDEVWGYLVRTVSVEEVAGGAVGTSGQVHFGLIQ